MVAQGLAVAIFVAMFVLIVMDKFGRQYITLGCGALILIGVFGICMRSVNAIWEIINLRSIFAPDFWYQGSGAAESGIGINWETVIFIACMMIMVEGMARVGFFDWLCMRIAKMVHFNTIPIFITFMIMSAVLAMFIDSITVILFLAAVAIELSSLLIQSGADDYGRNFLRKSGRFGDYVWRPSEYYYWNSASLQFCGFCVEYRCDCRYFPDCNCDLFLLCFPQGFESKNRKN